ncbi:MAG: proton extrusion protein PcxA [Phormidesmis sp.]
MTNSSQRPHLFGKFQQWFTKTPNRALDQAYEAALKIRQLEDNHFGGNPVSQSYGGYSPSSYRLLQKDLKKYLSIIKRRMAEFRASSSMYPVSSVGQGGPLAGPLTTALPRDVPLDQINGPAIFFSKLQLIDSVVDRYQRPAALALSQIKPPAASGSSALAGERKGESLSAQATGPAEETPNETLSGTNSVLPRSILRTVGRIRQDLNPEAEADVIRNFRSSKAQTTVAITFVLQLIIVPLLAQYLSKNFVIGPIVHQSRDRAQSEVFLNEEMEERALTELEHYEDRLRFELLIGKTPKIGEEEIEDRVRERAVEIEDEYRQRSTDAVGNVFADAIAVLAFSLLLTTSKDKIAKLKAFIDEIIYDLSDSAKAFIIILFTDVFVGFHSPHGWEVLLEGLSVHLGLPANHNFIFLFIATFPVILDTVFKYWIFRYLNRVSPSAVATYKNMNE